MPRADAQVLDTCTLIVVSGAAESGSDDDVKTLAHTNNFCLQAKVSLVSGWRGVKKQTQICLELPRDAGRSSTKLLLYTATFEALVNAPINKYL